MSSFRGFYLDATARLSSCTCAEAGENMSAVSRFHYGTLPNKEPNCCNLLRYHWGDTTKERYHWGDWHLSSFPLPQADTSSNPGLIKSYHLIPDYLNTLLPKCLQLSFLWFCTPFNSTYSCHLGVISVCHFCQWAYFLKSKGGKVDNRGRAKNIRIYYLSLQS